MRVFYLKMNEKTHIGHIPYSLYIKTMVKKKNIFFEIAKKNVECGFFSMKRMIVKGYSEMSMWN